MPATWQPYCISNQLCVALRNIAYLIHSARMCWRRIWFHWLSMIRFRNIDNYRFACFLNRGIGRVMPTSVCQGSASTNIWKDTKCAFRQEAGTHDLKQAHQLHKMKTITNVMQRIFAHVNNHRRSDYINSATHIPFTKTIAQCNLLLMYLHRLEYSELSIVAIRPSAPPS